MAATDGGQGRHEARLEARASLGRGIWEVLEPVPRGPGRVVGYVESRGERLLWYLADDSAAGWADMLDDAIEAIAEAMPDGRDG